MAMQIMRNNTVRDRTAIERLDLKTTDTMVEIGAGHGHGLLAIGQQQEIPKRIVCIEISPEFRTKLEKIKSEVSYGDRIEIYSADCKDMPFLEDESVDKIVAQNVVYFLHPLDVYLKEIRRVLKPDGFVAFGGAFGLVPRTGAFVNTEAASVISEMEKAGFRTMKSKVFSKDDKTTPLYIELKGIKTAPASKL